MTKNDQIDPRLAALLDELKTTPARDPQTAARTRRNFIVQAISAGEVQRHRRWTIFQRKEQFVMNLIVSTMVILGLLFGGSAAVSAAQDDLPNDLLYPVKLASEEVDFWLESDPIMKIEMLMEQVQTRTEEMAAMDSEGAIPPAELTIRIQERIRQALHLAAALEEPEMTRALEQIRTRLQTQEQLMSQLQDGSCMECELVLQQTRIMLQTQMRIAETSLADPATFRNQYQYQYQNQVQTPPASPATDQPIAPQGAGSPVPDGGGQQNGLNNFLTGTPLPPDNKGNGNGHGSGGKP